MMDGDNRRRGRRRRAEANPSYDRFEDPRLQLAREEDELLNRSRFRQPESRPRIRDPIEEFDRRAREMNLEILLERSWMRNSARRAVRFSEFSRSGGDRSRTQPRRDMVTKKMVVTTEAWRETLEGVLEARSSPDAELPVVDEFRTLSPSTSKLDSLEDMVAKLNDLPDEMLVIGGTHAGEHSVPGPAQRAYVPQSHGNGYHYGWGISLGVDLSLLLTLVEKQAEDGLRIAYITRARPTYSVPGIPQTIDVPTFDVVWIRDDDSNFRTGIHYVKSDTRGEALKSWLDLYKPRGMRPLCIVHTGTRYDEGFFVIVWIMDGAHGPEDWMVETAAFDPEDKHTQAPEHQGYRPIWATYHEYLTTVWVKDGHDEFWTIDGWIGTSDIDPIQQSFNHDPTLVPICVEIKRLDSPGPTRYVSIVIAVVDHDLRTVEEPGENWTWHPQGKEIGTAEFAASTGYLGNRPYAIAPTPHWTAQNPDYYVVREVANRLVLPVFRCIDDPVDKPLPPEALVGIDRVVKAAMFQSPILALSVAIRDDAGWRLRRGYTLAKWAYPDTYPESQFRVGSTSKMLTAFTVFATLHWKMKGLLALDMRVFDPAFWPSDLDPSTGGLVSEYPTSVRNLTVADLLAQKGGWRQSVFNPGAESREILDAVAASGQMSGWQAPSGSRLLPMVRADKFRYVLKADAFQNNTKDGVNDVWRQTGWRMVPIDYEPGDEPPAYSGWHYGMLGAVIELLDHGQVSGPREDFKLYEETVKARLLEPTGARRTLPGRQSRYFTSPGEVIYPTALSVQQDNVVTNDFKHTIMFSSKPSSYEEGTEHDWYPEDEEKPADVGRAPSYVSRPYGHDYNREATTPGGGWVSTAPDLCRILGALDLFSSVFGTDAKLVLLDTQNLTLDCLDVGFPLTPGGMFAFSNQRKKVWHGGDATGIKTRLRYHIPSRRRIVVCTNARNGWSTKIDREIEKLFE